MDAGGRYCRPGVSHTRGCVSCVARVMLTRVHAFSVRPNASHAFQQPLGCSACHPCRPHTRMGSTAEVGRSGPPSPRVLPRGRPRAANCRRRGRAQAPQTVSSAASSEGQAQKGPGQGEARTKGESSGRGMARIELLCPHHRRPACVHGHEHFPPRSDGRPSAAPRVFHGAYVGGRGTPHTPSGASAVALDRTAMGGPPQRSVPLMRPAAGAYRGLGGAPVPLPPPPRQEHDPADAHHQRAQVRAGVGKPPHGLGVCLWMHPVNGTGNSPSPGRPTPGVVKQDKSSGGSVDTTKTRSDPQRVRMSSGERPMGAAKGKHTNARALCQAPPPPPRHPLCVRTAGQGPPVHC